MEDLDPRVLGIEICPGSGGALFCAEEVDDLVGGTLGRTVVDREAARPWEAEEATQEQGRGAQGDGCLLYTSPSPRDS